MIAALKSSSSITSLQEIKDTSSASGGIPATTLPTPESMTDAIAEPSSSLCSPEEGEIAEGGGEAPASALDAAAVPSTLVGSCGTSPDSEESVLMQLASVPSTGSLSSRASRISHSAMSILAATLTTKADLVQGNNSEGTNGDNPVISGLDDFTRKLGEDDARVLVDLLKLAVANRTASQAAPAITQVLSGLAIEKSAIASMLTELCVTELEDASCDTEALRSVPQPVVQESSHPYTDDVTLTGIVLYLTS